MWFPPPKTPGLVEEASRRELEDPEAWVSVHNRPRFGHSQRSPPRLSPWLACPCFSSTAHFAFTKRGLKAYCGPAPGILRSGSTGWVGAAGRWAGGGVMHNRSSRAQECGRGPGGCGEPLPAQPGLQTASQRLPRVSVRPTSAWPCLGSRRSHDLNANSSHPSPLLPLLVTLVF